MKLYEYDSETGLYLREIEAIRCPLRGIYLPHENTTETPPLEPKSGYAVIFDDGWRYIEDNRGKAVYNTKTASFAGKITSVTEYLPEGFTFEVPNPDEVWKDGKWQPKPLPTLEELESMRKAQVQRAIELEAYPLMFQSFIGILDREVVLDKVEEIEKRFEV